MGDGPKTASTLLKSRFGFSAREIAKLEQLAALRGEPMDEAIARTLRNLTHVVPGTIKDTNIVTDAPVKSIEVVNGLARLELENGRILWTFLSRDRYRNLYYVIRDRLPKIVSADTYGPFHDVKFRYLRALEKGLVPKHPGAVLVDCGAYVGWKALGFYDRVEADAKVVAIEISAAQHAVLERNVAANNLTGKVIPVHCGVSNERGEGVATFKNYASHSLMSPDEHSHYSETETVQTDTLDNIFDSLELDRIDFLNVQTNGAEMKALEGLVRNFDKVAIIYVGAHYTLDGVPQRGVIKQYLQERGCRVVEVIDYPAGPGSRGGLSVVTPAWVDRVKLPDGYRLEA